MKKIPSKIKIIYVKIYPHHSLYYILSPKRQKDFFATKKTLRNLRLLSVLSDSVTFRFLRKKFLFRLLSYRALFDSSVIFFRVFSDRFLSCFISVFFLACRYFLSNRATTFYIKNIIISRI